MPLSSEDSQKLSLLRDLTYVNPFGDEREALERKFCADAYKPLSEDKSRSLGIIHANPDISGNPNLNHILKYAETLATKLSGNDVDLSATQTDQWFHTSLFILYHRFREPFDEMIISGLRQHAEKAKDVESGEINVTQRIAIFRQFVQDAKVLLAPLKGSQHQSPLTNLNSTKKQIKWLAHLFACFFQLRRAFYNIDCYIIGSSKPLSELRKQVWESIFTHDMLLYESSLYESMGDYALLITGPSGTGKELVARAVGLSRYIPFDPDTLTFADCFTGSFLPLNLSALSPTLIESELFGHKKGSYTGAQSDRKGWLEICSQVGSVFLDEIGELDPGIQVKLLRVLQDRQFSRLGETKLRTFKGKVIAATNRDLSTEITKKRFRQDLFYRLCSDHITMPSLQARFEDDPNERLLLIQFLLNKQLNCDAEDIQKRARDVNQWISQHLGDHYTWPGNVRELEQCIRSLIIRKHYQPLLKKRTELSQPQIGPACLQDQLANFVDAQMQTEDLLNIYCTIAYAKANSYEGAARLIGLDRRTVKSRLDQRLLTELKSNEVTHKT